MCAGSHTAKNTVSSPNFVVRRFCGKAVSALFRRFARNCAETVSFHEMSTPVNYVKIRYFIQSQWYEMG